MAGSTQKEEQVQEQVIRAARQLYQQYGLQKVTMEDVAKAVGKGKSSLYYYYKSKEEIFDAVIRVEIREIFAEIAKAVAKAQTIEDKIYTFCKTRLHIARTRKTSFNTLDLASAASEMPGIVQTTRNRFTEQEHEAIKQLLTAGIETGELRPMVEKEMDMTVFVVMSSFRGMKREILEQHSEVSEETAARTIAALAVNGLRV